MGQTTNSSQQRAALAEHLCRVAGKIAAHGWCQATSGNFSVVLEQEPLRVLATPSGVAKDCLSSTDLVLVDQSGQTVEDEAGTPSAEALLHCSIARTTGAGAILHTHSVSGTLLGEHFCANGGFRIGGYEMLKGLEGMTSHEDEVFVPVIPNSQDIPALCQDFETIHREQPDLPGFLIAGHGLYAWGHDLKRAHRQLETLEFLLECVERRTPLRPAAVD